MSHFASRLQGNSNTVKQVSHLERGVMPWNDGKQYY